MRRPDRWFRFLLRILPGAFRARHGEELGPLLERMKDELGPSPGRLALLRLRLAVTWDLLRQLPSLRAGFARDGERGVLEAGRTGGWDALAADARFALRQFGRTWGTTLTMLALLTLGMGISILLFSFVHSYAALPPPGVAAVEGLVRIRGSQADGYGGRGVRPFSEEEFLGYRRLTEPFSAVAGWAIAFVNLEGPEGGEAGPGSVSAHLVTENYFSVLGVRPVLGPGFAGEESEDPAAAMVVVIGHLLWDRHFGRSPDVIGRTVDLNGVPMTIVGVAPRGFVGIGGAGLWLPLASRHRVLGEATAGDLLYRAIARLSPGVSAAAATAAVEGVLARTAEALEAGEGPAAEPTTGPAAIQDLQPGSDVVPLLAANGDPMHERDVRLLVLSLGLLGVLVLLVTCTNVSALLTGLAMARRQEIAVRLSLGAPRARIVRQLLTESALLALTAGAGALSAAALVLHVVNERIPDLPGQFGITWPAALFTCGTALAVGIVFGLAPALHATRLGISGAMRDSATATGGQGLRLQRALVVAQIAFTQPLVVGVVAVLLFVMGQLQPPERTAVTEQLISVRLRPVAAGEGTVVGSSESMRVEVEALLRRLRETPGIAAAIPNREDVGDADSWSYVVHPDDRVADGIQSVAAEPSAVPPGYLATVGTPVVRGRDFVWDDPSHAARQGAEVPVVIGEHLAGRLWPGVDPLGRRLQAADESVPGPATLIVTGVTAAEGNGKRIDPRAGYPIHLVRDAEAAPTGLLVRTAASDARALLSTVREVARDAAPSMAANVRTVASIDEVNRSRFQIITRSLGGTAFLALFLSAIGLYAVVAFSVRQRRGEIAVRMAIGAPARRIARSFVFEGLRLSATGLLIGLPVGLIGLRLFNTLDPFGMPEIALLPVTVLGVVGILVVATGATVIPARWAAGTDPAGVLRG